VLLIDFQKVIFEPCFQVKIVSMTSVIQKTNISSLFALPLFTVSKTKTPPSIFSLPVFAVSLLSLMTRDSASPTLPIQFFKLPNNLITISQLPFAQLFPATSTNKGLFSGLPSELSHFHLSTTSDVVVGKPNFVYSEVDMFSDTTLTINPKVFNETLTNIVDIPESNERKPVLFKMATYLNEMRTRYFETPLIVVLKGRLVTERVIDYHLFIHGIEKNGVMMTDINSLGGVNISHDRESSKRIISDLHLMRKMGNDAAHDLREITHEDVIIVMNIAFNLVKHAYEIEKMNPVIPSRRVFNVGVKRPVSPPIRVERFQQRTPVKVNSVYHNRMLMDQAFYRKRAKTLALHDAQVQRNIEKRRGMSQDDLDKRRGERRALNEANRLRNIEKKSYSNAFDKFISDTLTTETEVQWDLNLKKSHAFIKGCNTLPTRNDNDDYQRGLGIWLEHNSITNQFKTMSPTRMDKWGAFKESLRDCCEPGPINTPLRKWLVDLVVFVKESVVVIPEVRRNHFRECRNRFRVMKNEWSK
jgi:hypothetical protein